MAFEPDHARKRFAMLGSVITFSRDVSRSLKTILECFLMGRFFRNLYQTKLLGLAFVPRAEVESGLRTGYSFLSVADAMDEEKKS